MGHITEQEDNETQIWEPPKDELERSVADHIEECFFEISEDANIKCSKAVQKKLNSKYKTIVSNLLNFEGVSSSSSPTGENWVEIITRLSWEAAEIVNPFVIANPIDPSSYIKVKCIATGSCSESVVLKGLVFTKHGAHKHMATKYENPKILLVKGAMGDYTNELSSFNRMSLSQGNENQARFIEACQPNVILVEKSVSRDLLFYILSRGDILVSDMNFQRLQMISSFFGSPIVPSDSLVNHNLKHCHSFRMESVTEEHNVVGKNGKMKSKSLMFLEGYGNSLGCTILLKGSHNDTLKIVKRVVKYSVILAYHLTLENYFLLDQQAMLSTILKTLQLEESGFDGSEAQNLEARDLNESITICGEDREHPLIFDPRVSIHTNTDDHIEPDLDYPSIEVLVSRRNACKGIICQPSNSLKITFYKNFDVSLEKFLQDLFNQGSRCSVCEELPQAHFYFYERCNIQLRIQVKRLHVGKRLPGEKNGNIWMWSRRCGENDVAKRLLMSTAAHSLSFGKFLDLSFSQQTRLDKCGHSFLHFFGLGYMVAMFSYSQVTTYTAALPQLKLEGSNSLKASWLEKEFRSVFTQGILMFEEVTSFLTQLRSNITSSGTSHHYLFKIHSNIEEILIEERSGFEENTRNDFNKAKTTLGGGSHKLLLPNRLRWELFLQALVWNYRLQSLVFDEHILYSPSESDIGKGSYNQWFWNSFEELRSKSIVEVEKEYKLESKMVCSFQKNLPIVNNIITEEGSRLHLSLGDEHCLVSDYEDELSSLIACALAHLNSDEKRMPLTRHIDDSLERSLDEDETSKQISSGEGSKFDSFTPPEILVTFGLADLHGKSKYSVMCLYLKEFCDFRKHCCVSELEYIDSLSRCEEWSPKDRTKESVFSKSLDDKFILKEITRIEYESFAKFGLEYFKYMIDTHESGNQTCLVKVFGIYKVITRQQNGRGERRYNLMVMENLNFGRNISHEYILKGPLLTRFTSITSDGAEEVMIGPEFFKDMNNYPVYFTKDSKHNLQSAVRNDISFLDSINVMDYSLLVGVDLERRELVCGIIDYLKLYTWDMTYPCRIL